jgi:hypothetical protein
LPDNIRIEFDYVPARAGGQNLVFMLAASQLGGGDLIADHVRRNGHYVWITNAEGAFGYKKESIEGKVIPPVASYTVSWWAPQVFKGRDGWAHRVPARKNPGHLLIGDAYVPVAEKDCLVARHVVLTKRGGKITMEVDGEVVHKIDDSGGQDVHAITRQADGTLSKEPMRLPVHGDGHFGFRTLHMWPEFRNFRVYRVDGAGATDRSASPVSNKESGI